MSCADSVKDLISLKSREELPPQAPPFLVPSGFHFDGHMGLSIASDTSHGLQRTAFAQRDFRQARAVCLCEIPTELMASAGIYRIAACLYCLDQPCALR